MDSIICPIIRFDVLPMCNWPYIRDFERNFNETFTDESIIDARYDNSEGYILSIGENYTEDENNIEWHEDEAWRCDIYKNIGPRQRKSFTLDEAIKIGRMLGIDWESSKFDADQFRIGLDVELEHGRRDMLTNVTNDDPILTGKIALAHLNELSDYYIRLTKMEKEAMAHFGV
ncbi:MAG: hypothetical protein K0R09_1223 [Clostridiales bacterium]|nr:hypothetical protein [Clostridiales bacterium]